MSNTAREDSLQLYTINAAAELLACSRRQIYTLIESGELGTIAIGSRMYISAEEIAAYQKRHFHRSRPAKPSRAQV